MQTTLFRLCEGLAPSFLPPFIISFFPTWVVSKDNKIALFLWTPIEAKAARSRGGGEREGGGEKASPPTDRPQPSDGRKRLS